MRPAEPKLLEGLKTLIAPHCERTLPGYDAMEIAFYHTLGPPQELELAQSFC